MSVTTGPGVPVVSVVAAGAVSLSPIHTGPPIEIGSGSYLPIDTTGTATGFVLVAGTDGIYRPAPMPDAQRGSVVHYLTDDPAGIPTGVVEGDWVAVIAGTRAGTVYHAEET